MDTSDKPERILRAALVTFVERGFHGTTVPEIAAAAELGAGTLYRYFESKEAIGNALYRHWKCALAEALSGGLDESEPPQAQFAHIVARAFDFARAHPLAMQLLEMHHHLDYLDAQSRLAAEQALAPVHAFFDRSVRDGTLRDASPGLLAALAWGGAVGVMRAVWDEGGELTPEIERTTVAALWEAVRHR
jgi:AcrR family transcriptional regulator